MSGHLDPDGLIASQQALVEQRKKAEALKADVEALALAIHEALLAAPPLVTALATAAAKAAQEKLDQAKAKIAELEQLATEVAEAFRVHKEKEEAAAKKKLEEAKPSAIAEGTIKLALSSVPESVPSSVPVCPAAQSSSEKTIAALAKAKDALATAEPEVLAVKKDALIKRVTDRVAAADRFTLTYLPAQLSTVIDKGRALGLSEKTIEDLIYIASRNDKPLDPATLMTQMTNWAETISEREYPYRFKDEADFKKFSNELVDALAAKGVPVDDIRIQGSSLRKEAAGDVDIAAFVSQAKFDEILVDHFKNKIKKGTPPVAQVLTGKSHAQLMELVREIDADRGNTPRLFNAQAGTFMHAMKSGIVNSKSDVSPAMKAVAKKMAKDYPHLNIETISFLIKDGLFDLDPSMPVKKT